MLTTLPAGHHEIDHLRARVDTLEQERRHLLALNEVLREIGGSLHDLDIVQAVARRLGQAFGLDRCSVFLAERGGGTIHLVASYEDPSIRNHVVDLSRYPELRRALETGQTVHIPEASEDPELAAAVEAFSSRRVKSITVVPMSWRGAAIGAIFLRTFRDGPATSDADIRFVEVVAELTATALRNAHRFERLQARRGEAGLSGERERAALLGFLRRLLEEFSSRNGAWHEGLLARANAAELDRLVGVALAVIAQEAAAT
jgi:GAF domain-containing protein